MDDHSRLAERIAVAEQLVRETPVVRLDDERLELYAKLEYLNGVGSVKDRPALWILKKAIERREIGPNTTVVESSSGNFACALATFCSTLELNFIPVIDPNISPLYETYLRTHCAQVIKVDERDDTGGFLKTRLHTVRSLLAQRAPCYWPNQYENVDGAAAHYYLTGNEIWNALPTLDYLFLGVSSGATLAGVSRCIKQHSASVRIIAVDVEGSMIFGALPKRRYISGLGSSILPPLVREALVDDVVIVSERETVTACLTLQKRHGLFVGGSTGSAYAAIQTYFGRNPPGSTRPKVLFLCCDRGTAYLHSVFNEEWVVRYLYDGERQPLSQKEA